MLNCIGLRRAGGGPLWAKNMKTLIAILLVAVIISLGSALSSMTSPDDRSARMLRALTVRVVLSIALVIVLVISWKFGLVEPHAGG